MTQPLDFQSMILALQHFWADQVCLIWQPYNQQVGAGTMNPATFLRVLGPEPWNVAYVEPSVRPDDGRYGENPYRLQQHTQFQVILKPDPGNPQELSLLSLAYLSHAPADHPTLSPDASRYTPTTCPHLPDHTNINSTPQADATRDAPPVPPTPCSPTV